MAKNNSGYENVVYIEKDIGNYLDKKRRLALEIGDA